MSMVKLNYLDRDFVNFQHLSDQIRSVIKYVATATTPCEMVHVKNMTSFVGLQHFQ